MRRAKKGIKAHRAKLPTPTRAIDALRGAEKKNRIKNRRKNKINKANKKQRNRKLYLNKGKR